jgi:hypothetical protein
MCGYHFSSLVCSGVHEKVSGYTSLPCMGCKLGKQLQFSYSSSQIVSTVPFGLVYSNVWGPTPFVLKGDIIIM